MCQYSVRNKILLLSIVILSMLYVTGCEQTINPNENVRFEAGAQIMIKADQNIWEAVDDGRNNSQTEIDAIQATPEIEIISDYGVKTKIKSEEEYEVFIRRLEELTSYSYLWMDLGGTNTTIYLDEILNYNNFEFLQIKNGGSVSYKDIHILTYPIRTIEFRHVFAIDECMINHILYSDSYVHNNFVIELDSRYSGKLPIEELLGDKDCINVILIWDDDTEGEGLLDVQEGMESLKEWDYLQTMWEMADGCLKGVYRLNDEDYNYTSYEFYNYYEESGAEISAAFICVKDRESNGKEYFDIIDVPVDKFSNYLFYRDTYPRVGVSDDLNFDGYKDLIFMGRNDGIYPYWNFITFLWDEEKQKFILDESAPFIIDWVDAERKRLTYSTALSAFDEDYYIYEYTDNMFAEKHIEIRTERMSGSRTLQYFEDGKLIARLELVIDEDGSRHFFYEEIDGTREEVQVESGLLFREVSELYFPEFDFYRVG